MPAPTTPVLYAFGGADQIPLTDGGNFIQDWSNTTETLNQIANEAVCTAATDNSGDVYWFDEFHPNQEVYLTMNAKVNNGRVLYVVTRLRDPSSTANTYDCYMLRVRPQAGTDIIDLGVVTNKTFTLLDTADLELAAGDKFWLHSCKTTHRVYVDQGAGWVLHLQARDATWTLPGFIAFAMEGPAGRVNSFGGGEVSCPTGHLPRLHVGT